MECLSTKVVMASLSAGKSSSRQGHQHAPKVHPTRIAPPSRTEVDTEAQKRRQPSIAEVQKVIGARRDHNSRAKGRDSAFMDAMLSSPFAQPEGPAERKLREIGEWIIGQTESGPRAGQHTVLTVLSLYILPVWLMALMVASGLVQLPFDVPFLEDLIM